MYNNGKVSHTTQIFDVMKNGRVLRTFRVSGKKTTLKFFKLS